MASQPATAVSHIFAIGQRYTTPAQQADRPTPGLTRATPPCWDLLHAAGSWDCQH
ncbi:uncharacterized protein K444DRAFT_614517 [Hyaloscypha bicolor E]|uniref:Uncharacterized protein n=1 Tax=Hyaloscypha bicolor E TaxID=1095630 RepID=A0A2J6T5P1_9HELO|nr:uncharacterized protein K444DRAFT_614517 [Hyaloscypha bicolor E]PMD58263.1 hypothetical protein K444DRAFT_614517 [Hyaloscypha bicolor E]